MATAAIAIAACGNFYCDCQNEKHVGTIDFFLFRQEVFLK